MLYEGFLLPRDCLLWGAVLTVVLDQPVGHCDDSPLLWACVVTSVTAAAAASATTSVSANWVTNSGLPVCE